MPRIPVRTEPYSSPSRQHRHFKNKRDQVLRALGKSAYINGSHFAIMWVSASGQAETYASEAFQGRLEDWFETSGIKQEGRNLILDRKAKATGLTADSTACPIDLLQGEGGVDDDTSQRSEDDSDCGEDEADSLLEPAGGGSAAGSSARPSLGGSGAQSTLSHTPVTNECDGDNLFGDNGIGPPPIAPISQAHAEAVLASASAGNLVNSTASLNRPNRKLLTPLDIGSANLPFATQSFFLATPLGSAGTDDRFLRAPLSAPLPNQRRLTIPMRAPLIRTNSLASANLTQVTLLNQASRTAFFELRFGQMQQGMCKTVAKAWIKIIEPKKQTRCPYNKGEEGKPEWWPEGVRHKEPDHLMKPERHSLLLTILRSPKIKVSRLQLATAEVAAMIKADKVNLLMDVYRIAREEERLRESGKGLDRPITVGVSTLQGWHKGGLDGRKGGLSEEGKRMTMGDDVTESHQKKLGADADRHASGSDREAQVQSRKRNHSHSSSRIDAGGSSSKNPAMTTVYGSQVPIDKRARLTIIKGEDTEAESSLRASFSEGHRPNSITSFTMTPEQQERLSMPTTFQQGEISGSSSLRRQAYSQAAVSSAMAAAGGPPVTRLYVQESSQQQQQQYADRQLPHAQNMVPSSLSQLRYNELDGRYAAHYHEQQHQRFPSEGHPHPGTMSAPQASSARLYPEQNIPQHFHHHRHEMPQHHQQRQAQISSLRETISATSSPVLSYSYQQEGQNFLDSFGAGQQQIVQRPQHNDTDTFAGGALGLQGLGVGMGSLPEGMVWHEPIEAHATPQQGRWGSSPSMQSHIHTKQQQQKAQDEQVTIFEAQMARASSMNRAAASPVNQPGSEGPRHPSSFVINSSGEGDESMGNMTFDMDQSFTSASSHNTGPATPPTHHAHQHFQQQGREFSHGYGGENMPILSCGAGSEKVLPEQQQNQPNIYQQRNQGDQQHYLHSHASFPQLQANADQGNPAVWISSGMGGTFTGGWPSDS